MASLSMGNHMGLPLHIMDYTHAILLGIVQGLTEFLPISSSAHLVLFPWLFNFEDPGLTFDVALHFGTLFAILFFFWRDWTQILSGAFRHCFSRCKAELSEGNRTQFHLLAFIAVATVPAAITGVFLDDLAEHALRHPLIVAFNLVFWGAALLWADKKSEGHRRMDHLRFWECLFVGVAQSLALVPGVSRSGVTMTAGLIRHLDRVSAARFSFLLATPITLGACLMKLDDFLEGGVSGAALMGIAVSTLVGFLCIKYLLYYIQHYSFRVFGYYRFGLAGLVLGLHFLG